MKKIITLFLQTLTVLIGVATLGFLLWEPTVEGRNAGATLYEMYFNDPFLACAYLVSVLFFIVLYQACRVFGYMRQGATHSSMMVRALRTIQYCALGLAGFAVVGELYLFIFVRGTDDIAGGVAMGFFIFLISSGIATAAGVYRRSIQRAMNVEPDTLMTIKNIALIGVLLCVVAAALFFLCPRGIHTGDLDPTPRNVTLSGTYVCLPHLDTSGPQTEECAFGLKTDDGVYYAVNFGASAGAMKRFQSGAHITAEGFVVITEALSTDHWQHYNMKGIFTVLKMVDPA
jgi:hypothetical protein